MFLRKAAFLVLIILCHFSSAQRKKKKNDTIYVYEKVIVYDTIYLEKPLKIRFNDIVPPILTITTNDKITALDPKLKRITASPKNGIPTFHYGVEAGIGLKNSTWTQKLSEDGQQFGENIGIWVAKDIINTLSLMLNFNVYHWNSTFNLDANKEDTYLNGYYFTTDNYPLLFQKFNNKHFEYALHVKLIYEWKNFRPYAGILMNKNSYKMQFMVPQNNILNKLDNFKTNQINLGFSFGLQYRILKKILLTADYQQYKLKNISLKNSSLDFDIFNTNNTFAERKINLGVSYMISR